MEITNTKKIYILFIMLLSVVAIKNVYATNKCSALIVKLNKQTDIILNNINSLKTCIKPASKYRLKTCIKRKQEGSKGFNCLSEVTQTLYFNKNIDCKVKLNNINRLLVHLVALEENHDFCLQLEKK